MFMLLQKVLQEINKSAGAKQDCANNAPQNPLDFVHAVVTLVELPHDFIVLV
jgi:hypothetical protein